MLDMGFEPEVRRVVTEFGAPDKGKRQTLMFSATFPEEIQKLAADFLVDHIFLTVGVVGGTTSDIQQNVIEVTDNEKREKLQEILSSSGRSPSPSPSCSDTNLTVFSLLQALTESLCLWRLREMLTFWPVCFLKSSSLPPAFTGQSTIIRNCW